MKTTSRSSRKHVRFASRITICVFTKLSLVQDLKSNLWYSTEETDRFKVWLAHRVQEVRSQLQDDSEGGVTINAAAILGLEKYLTPELTAAYNDRRLALQRAVLEEHRRHSVMRVPQSTARLAMISVKHSQWARERARAAALFLEQDVMRDMKEMNLQETVPRPSCCSMSRLNEADVVEEVHKWHLCQRRWSVASSSSSIRNKI